MGQVSQNARRLGHSCLANAVDLLAEIDRRTKSGLGDAAGNVERFILSMGPR
jgi:DNA polymerase III delta subunit